MAYASLLSLGEMLEQILHPDSEYLRLHQTEQQFMRLVHEKVAFLVAFLGSISPKSSENVVSFEERIRDAAFLAEDLIETKIYPQRIPSKYSVSNQIDSKWWKLVKEELDTISEGFVQMKESEEIEILQPTNCLPAASSKSGSANKSVIVGFDYEVYQVKELLLGGPSTLEIISICGQGGIGKTTLARKIYNDLGTTAHFHIRAWVTVSQELCEQQLIEDILKSTGDLNHESRKQSIDKLTKKLYKRLKHKRFLIVMDDVCVSAIENIKTLVERWLPEDNNGSRILLTTRSILVSRLANSYINPHMLKFLSSEECWDRLCHIVFREELCPPELVMSTQAIQTKCKGDIPLQLS